MLWKTRIWSIVQAGNTLFTPHYMARECTSGLESLDCKNNCIHYGRYCSMDSIGDEYKDTYKGWQASKASRTLLGHTNSWPSTLW